MFTLHWRPGKWRPRIENQGRKTGRVKLLYVLYTVTMLQSLRYMKKYTHSSSTRLRYRYVLQAQRCIL